MSLWFGGRRIPGGLQVRILCVSVCVSLFPFPATRLLAQAWNDSTTLDLVHRAILARQAAEPDSTLRSYHTTAHGFVYFLAQAGRNLDAPPRLIKADELQVEVYWRAPSTSKQVIRGWRDGRWLPTDISYHRDHVAIVTGNFGDSIRIGEGDEVRDVPHPLAPGATDLYDYRLGDSLRVEGREGTLRLRLVEVRPRDATAPRILGTLSLDAERADLVRFRFSFTASAYLDHSLEDLSVSLENARLEGRWWLPWRQEIEIRRRLTWLDFPARTIIRGRWEIGDYDLNVELPASVLAGPAIGGLRAPVDTGGEWTGPLAAALDNLPAVAGPQEISDVRREAERLADGRLRSGLPRARLGLASLSDLAHVNRVQGLALGAGVSFAPAAGLTLRPSIGFGTSDARLTGSLRAERARGPTTVALMAGRAIRDLADRPISSGIVNSLLAQEGGRDLGDYTLLDVLAGSVTRRLGASAQLSATVGAERSRSVKTEASPATGRYRPNPVLGAGTITIGRLAFNWTQEALVRSAATELEVNLEGGTGARDYLRANVRAAWLTPFGPGALRLSGAAGTGTSELPAYRSFAVGGWGTLPGEAFRRWGGRQFALGRLEYRFDLPFPAVPLGPFVSTGRSFTLAPFLAAGWSGGGIAGLPWAPSGGARPVAGVAIELFHHLVQAEFGVGLHDGGVGVSVDVDRSWWEIL